MKANDYCNLIREEFVALIALHKISINIKFLTVLRTWLIIKSFHVLKLVNFSGNSR